MLNPSSNSTISPNKSNSQSEPIGTVTPTDPLSEKEQISKLANDILNGQNGRWILFKSPMAVGMFR